LLEQSKWEQKIIKKAHITLRTLIIKRRGATNHKLIVHLKWQVEFKGVQEKPNEKGKTKQKSEHVRVCVCVIAS